MIKQINIALSHARKTLWLIVAFCLAGCYELSDSGNTRNFDISSEPINSVAKGEDARSPVLLLGNKVIPYGVPDFEVFDQNNGTNINDNFSIMGLTNAYDETHESYGYMNVDTPDGKENVNLIFVRYNVSSPRGLVGGVWLHSKHVKGIAAYMQFSEGRRVFEIKKICHLTSPATIRHGPHPGAAPHFPEQHLIMSVKMCDTSNPRYCKAGIIDTTIGIDALSNAKTWRLRSDQKGYYASMRKPDGGYFSNECMPLESTRNISTSNERQQHVVAVLDPSMSQISLFDATDIRIPLGSLNWRSGKRILDFAFEETYVKRNGKAESHGNATLIVLYREGGDKFLAHFAIVDSQLMAEPFLKEMVRDDARNIVAEIADGEQDRGVVYVIGENGTTRRDYRKTE